MTKVKLNKHKGLNKMCVELIIKNKHLSEEAKIIRSMEHKVKRQVDWLRNKEYYYSDEYIEKFKLFLSLKEHRRMDVRRENRATYLARAFINGVEYNRVEQKRKKEREYEFKWYIIPRVVSMVRKYGGKNHHNITKEEILEWVDKIS